MRVLVTGGAGFIGSHFAKRLKAAGDDVRVLDKLTYSGNPANLEGTGIELVAADICDAEAVAEAAAGFDAIVNFAAETHVDRSILGAGRVHPDELLRACRCCSTRRVARASASSRSRRTRSTATSRGACPRSRTTRSARRARTAPPRPAATCRCSAYVRTYGVDALITRGSNTYGPYQYPEKLIPLFLRTRSTASRCRCTATATRSATGSTSRTTAPGSRLALRQGRAGEAYNIGGGEEARTARSRRSSSSTRAPTSRSSAGSRTGPDTTAATRSTRRRLARSSAGRLQTAFAEGFPLTAAWYSDNRDWWEPIKSSGGYREYYERQYAARLAGS